NEGPRTADGSRRALQPTERRDRVSARPIGCTLKGHSVMSKTSSRRTFVKTVVTVAAAAGGSGVRAQQAGGIRGFDHVALPVQHTDPMVAFYRALGLTINDRGTGAVSVFVGAGQMINFHRQTRWQDPAFTLRAPAAKPPCGDLCFVWQGTPASLKE